MYKIAQKTLFEQSGKSTIYYQILEKERNDKYQFIIILNNKKYQYILLIDVTFVQIFLYETANIFKFYFIRYPIRN